MHSFFLRKTIVSNNYRTLSCDTETTKDDAGDYSIEITNPSGVCHVNFPLTIRAVPGSCRAPIKASDVTFTTAHLSWTPPSDNGGSKVTHYVIEKKEAGKSYWSTVSSQVRQGSTSVLSRCLMVPRRLYHLCDARLLFYLDCQLRNIPCVHEKE